LHDIGKTRRCFLRLTRSFQSTITSQITERSAKIQWEAIEDPELQPLLGFPSGEKAECKRKVVVARIINNFANIFDLWQLGGMSTDTWRTFQTDLAVFISRAEVVERWRQLERFDDPKFVGMINSLINCGAAAPQA
jgi:hypothetical protein